jgi:hypothetical protein
MATSALRKASVRLYLLLRNAHQMGTAYNLRSATTIENVNRFARMNSAKVYLTVKAMKFAALRVSVSASRDCNALWTRA